MKKNARLYAEVLYSAINDSPKSDVSVIVKKFIDLLISERSSGAGLQIIKNFEDVWNENKGVIKIEVESPFKISGSLLKKIKQACGGQKVEVEEKENKELIGGIRLKIKDTVIDSSIKTQLIKLKQVLSS